MDPELLIRRAGEYAESDEGNGEYVKMPSSWLNQSCWEDDPQAWQRHQTEAEGETRRTYIN